MYYYVCFINTIIIFQVNNAVKCVLKMPKKEMALLTKETAIALTMNQNIIKEYTSSWNIINIEFQSYEDDDTYVFIKTDRTSVLKIKSTDSTTIAENNI